MREGRWSGSWPMTSHPRRDAGRTLTHIGGLSHGDDLIGLHFEEGACKAESSRNTQGDGNFLSKEDEDVLEDLRKESTNDNGKRANTHSPDRGLKHRSNQGGKVKDSQLDSTDTGGTRPSIRFDPTEPTEGGGARASLWLSGSD
eukprot:scaffold108940_cov38-Tisochrysis_lutea.AAC.1